MIRIGTDCTGIDALHCALKSMSVDFDYRFASEPQLQLQHFLKNMSNPPKQLYNTIEERLELISEEVDLYVTGFPCQSFSVMGKKAGFEDARGTVFFDVLKYLQLYQPKVFILENVKGLLTHEKGKTMNTILHHLQHLSVYDVSYKVLSPTSIGFPHHRQRVFIIGVHKVKQKVVNGLWDLDIINVTLPNLLLSRDAAITIQPTCNRALCRSAQCNLVDIQNTLTQKGYDSNTETIIADLSRGVSYTRYSQSAPTIGVCPCLRLNSRDYWITNQHRYITWKEALLLQGFDGNTFGSVVCRPPKKSKAPSQRLVFMWAGNSICVPLLSGILKPIVYALSKKKTEM